MIITEILHYHDYNPELFGCNHDVFRDCLMRIGSSSGAGLLSAIFECNELWDRITTGISPTTLSFRTTCRSACECELEL